MTHQVHNHVVHHIINALARKIHVLATLLASVFEILTSMNFIFISGVWEHLWEKVWNNLKCLQMYLKYWPVWILFSFQECESICEKKYEIIWNAWKDIYAFQCIQTALKVCKRGFVKSKKAEIRLKSELSHPLFIRNCFRTVFLFNAWPVTTHFIIPLNPNLKLSLLRLYLSLVSGHSAINCTQGHLEPDMKLQSMLHIHL